MLEKVISVYGQTQSLQRFRGTWSRSRVKSPGRPLSQDLSSRQCTRPSTGIPKLTRNPSAQDSEVTKRFRVTSSNQKDVKFRTDSPEAMETATLLQKKCESMSSTNYIPIVEQPLKPFEKTGSSLYKRKRTLQPYSVDKLPQTMQQPHTINVSPRLCPGQTPAAASTRY